MSATRSNKTDSIVRTIETADLSVAAAASTANIANEEAKRVAAEIDKIITVIPPSSLDKAEKKNDAYTEAVHRLQEVSAYGSMAYTQTVAALNATFSACTKSMAYASNETSDKLKLLMNQAKEQLKMYTKTHKESNEAIAEAVEAVSDSSKEIQRATLYQKIGNVIENNAGLISLVKRDANDFKDHMLMGTKAFAGVIASTVAAEAVNLPGQMDTLGSLILNTGGLAYNASSSIIVSNVAEAVVISVAVGAIGYGLVELAYKIMGIVHTVPLKQKYRHLLGKPITVRRYHGPNRSASMSSRILSYRRPNLYSRSKIVARKRRRRSHTSGPSKTPSKSSIVLYQHAKYDDYGLGKVLHHSHTSGDDFSMEGHSRRVFGDNNGLFSANKPGSSHKSVHQDNYLDAVINSSKHPPSKHPYFKQPSSKHTSSKRPPSKQPSYKYPSSKQPSSKQTSSKQPSSKSNSSPSYGQPF
jgi:hypothetical protein